MVGLKAEIINCLFTKRRIVNLLIGLGAVAVYELARVLYRPLVYSRGINDFHIADTLGNSLGTVAAVFVFASLLGRGQTSDIFLIRTVTISTVMYELAHPLLGKPIDPWDILATIAAGFFSEGLYRLIHRRT